MPEYLVRFLTPVLYNAGHSKAAWVATLTVRAPDVTGALTHAVRVVQGDVGGMTIEPYVEHPVAPVIEVS
jgi:hypothetical protein